MCFFRGFENFLSQAKSTGFLLMNQDLKQTIAAPLFFTRALTSQCFLRRNRYTNRSHVCIILVQEKLKRKKMAFVCAKYQCGRNKKIQKYHPSLSKADIVFIWSHLAVQRIH